MTDTAARPIAPVVTAATILLLRAEPAFEVLMVQRHHQIDFAAGALVFPGGKIHDGDRDPLWAERCVAWDETPAEERALRIAAIREAFEETGVLLARDAHDLPFRGGEGVTAARHEVETDPGALMRLMIEHSLRIDLSALTVFAQWITPTIMPKRFDTWFYVAAAPPDQLAACDGRETVDALWIEPAEALRLGAVGERTVIFPTRLNLELLAEASGADDAIARAKARPLVTVLPRMIDGEGGRRLVIPDNAGYRTVSIAAADLP